MCHLTLKIRSRPFVSPLLQLEERRVSLVVKSWLATNVFGGREEKTARKDCV
jgi:hypothetical protein